ncbi:MAG: O-antigen ligase family protein [candidate division WOR-3 bacterium]
MRDPSKLLGLSVALIAFLMVVFHYGWMSPIKVGPPINMVIIASALFTVGIVSFGSLPLTAERRRGFILDGFFLAFVAAIILSTLIGLNNGNEFKAVVIEAALLSLYGCYWLVSRFGPPGAWMGKALFIALNAASAIVALEFLYIYMIHGVGRVMSEQTTMTMAAFFAGLNYTIIFRKRPPWERALAFLGMGVALFTVLAAMQRTVWAAMAILLPLNLILLWMKKYMNTRTLIFSLGGIAGGIVLILLAIYLSPLRWTLELFYARFTTIGYGVSDPSLRLRYLDSAMAMKLFSRSPILGIGLGSPIWIRWSKEMVPIMDNSFLVFLWKTGIAGTTAFLMFYLAGIALAMRGFFTEGERAKAFVYLGVFVLLAGPLVVGTTTSMLYSYRFNFILGAGMGCLALLRKGTETEGHGLL